MMEYLLKVSVVLGIGWLFYKCVLQQESFFVANRLYLLGCIALAFSLPFITLPQLVSHQGYLTAVFRPLQSAPTKEASPEQVLAVQQKDGQLASEPPVNERATQTDNQLKKGDKPEKQADPGPTGWLFWLAALYFFGVIVFALQLLLQIGSLLLKVRRCADKIEDGNYTIINTSSQQPPCSFFRYVFIYPDAYEYETYEQIIAHEKIHVRKAHSVDLLLAEIAVAVLWFNPLSWLLKREIEKNIEYQTDAALLETAPDSKQQYQLNLLRIATYTKPLTLTTNYNQSLLKQRILMMNAKKSTDHRYWKYAFLAPLFFITLLLLNEPAASQALIATVTLPAPEKLTQEPDDKPASTVSIRDSRADMSQGYWYSRRIKGDYCIEFKGSTQSSTWNMTECFEQQAFEQTEKEVFELTREAGRLELMGSLDEEVSQGKYVFTPDADFEQYLDQNQIRSSDANLLFHLFFADVTENYVDFLQDNYGKIDGDRLLEVAIHDISQRDYRMYLDLFQKYSHKKPSMQEVIEAKIHGVEESYVREIHAAGFPEVPLKKIMELRIHDVDANYIETLASAGFDGLSIDQILEAKIHGLTPALIEEYSSLGFGELGFNKMVELKIHDVNAAFIDDLAFAGFKNLTADQVLEAKIHDVDLAAIEEIQSFGFGKLSLNKIMEAKIHGVNAAFLEGLTAAGFSDLSIDKAIEAKIHDVDGAFIRQAKSAGYRLESLEEYIQLKILGFNRNARRD